MNINSCIVYNKRKGSVLLQTLVMCVVLSFIGVMLTQWILARYSSSSRLYNDTTTTNGGIHGISNNFSIAAVRAGTGATDGYTTCYGKTGASSLDDSTGVSYATPECTQKGSGASLSNQYKFTVVVP